MVREGRNAATMMPPGEAEPHLGGIKRLAARPFAQDILQVLEQSGAPTGSAQRHPVHRRVPRP
jgi:hypothetical protein